MPRQPNSFPFPDSFALLDEGAETQLVRIISAVPGTGDVFISFPLRDGASANRRIALADLVNADPLDTDEIVEMHRLDREIGARRSRPKGTRRKPGEQPIDTIESRYEWLRNRDIRSEKRKRLLEALDRREKRARLARPSAIAA